MEKETFSKSEVFEKEGKWAGEYSNRLLSLMRSQVARVLKLSSDPQEQGHYFLDKSWRWSVLYKHGRAEFRRTRNRLTYHHDSIDFKDEEGEEQVKFARRNSKLPKGAVGQFSEMIKKLDGHYYFTRKGIDALISLEEEVSLNGHTFYPELLDVKELEEVILPAMPGKERSEQIRQFAKLMRLQPLGYRKDNLPYFSKHANDVWEEGNYSYTTDAGEKVTKKGEPLATVPHCRYPLTDKEHQRSSVHPFLVSGKEINDLVRLNNDEQILTPFRCKLIRKE